jgi:hypothetical protein
MRILGEEGPLDCADEAAVSEGILIVTFFCGRATLSSGRQLPLVGTPQDATCMQFVILAPRHTTSREWRYSRLMLGLRACGLPAPLWLEMGLQPGQELTGPAPSTCDKPFFGRLGRASTEQANRRQTLPHRQLIYSHRVERPASMVYSAATCE